MDVMALDHENVEMILYQVSQYYQHGFDDTFDGPAVVVDVGANIGLFALETLRRSQGQAHVYCFEPIPETYALLEMNLAGQTDVTLSNHALGAERETRTFTYNRRVPLMSTMHQLDLDVIPDRVLTILHGDVDEAYRQGIPGFMKYVPALLLRSVLKGYLPALARQNQCIACPVVSLSQFIDDQGLDRIDLLKIDVEKAEAEVLEGIATHDWPKIHRLAVEVHDIDSRLQTLVTQLREQGFQYITVEQEPFYRNSDVYSIFARRVGGGGVEV
jgi:FkbM family methyltransferase